MNRFKKNYHQIVAAVAGGVALGATNAFAAVDLTEATAGLSLASVETLAGTIIAGLAALWVIRKIIKTTNRS